ncbi:hypothetical protein NDU88_007045 [Pleurodeles waltl]|uniref:Uncharacterized protein n=1 Tax=Pleurodeles waltl TaxID=8319 RepID=A0AAV7NAF5_PLEWA|nr:hypothetical protein NDU88_007045 [Pleurodeles waltl]
MTDSAAPFRADPRSEWDPTAPEADKTPENRNPDIHSHRLTSGGTGRATRRGEERRGERRRGGKNRDCGQRRQQRSRKNHRSTPWGNRTREHSR